jgi:cytochrome c553
MRTGSGLKFNRGHVMTRIETRRLSLYALLMYLIATCTFAQSNKASDDAAIKLASQVCSSCHGPGGNSTSPTFPKLAAQQQAYLVAQIQAFKSGRRGEQEAHDYMLGMTTLIDDATAEALARYFARQPPPHGVSTDPALMAAGQKLFTQGITDRVVPCASCHGDHAQGNSIFPRLAGQHAPYIVRQLKVIQGNLRNSPVMHGIIKDLTPKDMDEVAAYLQSL